MPVAGRFTPAWQAKERPAMYIYGTAHVHAAQPLNSPHRTAPAQAPSTSPYAGGVDQLDISPEADFVAQARDLPEIREDRVASIRAQIQAGTYDTPEKLDIALSRLLDEIA
jgi:negative regulator of flagellin synthesis FlgM